MNIDEMADEDFISLARANQALFNRKAGPFYQGTDRQGQPDNTIHKYSCALGMIGLGVPFDDEESLLRSLISTPSEFVTARKCTISVGSLVAMGFNTWYDPNFEDPKCWHKDVPDEMRNTRWFKLGYRMAEELSKPFTAAPTQANEYAHTTT